MKVVLYVFLGLIGLIALAILVVTGIGMFLPKQHEITRRIQLQQPPAAVWAVIADYEGQPAWRKDAVRVERQPDRNGRDRWRISTDHGSSGFFTTVSSEPPRRLVLEHLAASDGPVFITWEFAVEPVDNGTRLTIRETGDFGNPYTRFMVRYVLGQTKFVDDYLTYLAAKFGESAAIQ